MLFSNETGYDDSYFNESSEKESNGESKKVGEKNKVKMFTPIFNDITLFIYIF